MQGYITPFVVLFQARSGSTFLISVLKNHPEVLAQGEILVGGDGEQQRNRALRALKPPEEDKEGIKAAGFKCKFRDIADYASFSGLLREVGAKVIHLYRDNTVKRVVSLLNAIRLEEATGYWNLHAEENRPGPFRVDPTEFDRRLQYMEASKSQTAALVHSLDLPTLTLRYEDILVSADLVLERLFRFLDVATLPIGGRTLKTTSDDLRLVVTNFDELKSQYLGTVFESMFEEVLV